MRGRRRREGAKLIYYYCGRDRKEIPLGTDLGLALARYKELNSEPVTNAAMPSGFAKGLFSQTAKRARRRGLPFTLTLTDVEEMLAEQDGRCAVSGIRFSASVYLGQRIRPWVPSVDRRKPAEGYTRDNVRIVCAAVNLSINQFGDEVFYRIATGVVKNRQKLRITR
ncbi:MULTISPECIES: hypothetical protein [unclassified Rhodanobacter]|uniref:hypothetical protein n=1 Tax=unclassified Rhodanobacter TaxID=2621553 RepID=UPI0012904C19|nr:MULTISPECIES: hypothetical protein [unclassified Rhodanobacter]